MAGCCSRGPWPASAAVLSTPATPHRRAGSGDQVNINNFAFGPATLTVPAGATVTWTNNDEEPHTVAANDGSFHSPGMGTVTRTAYLLACWNVRLHLLDPPDHARHRGGDDMTDKIPTGMTRRQLMRHTAWFGAAVALTVAGGEVISHVAGAAGTAQPATPTLRFAQISDSHIGFTGPANANVTDTFSRRDQPGQRPRLHPGLRHPHRRPDPPGHARTSSIRSSR